MDSGNIIDFPKRGSGDEPPQGIKPDRKPEGKGRLRPIVGFMAAACVTGAAILLGLGSHSVQLSPKLSLTGVFTTQRGEHRCETLPEQSQVCLNTGTTVRFVFTGFSRYLEVVAGEATFTVHGDPRPFEVLSGKLLVRDVSTQFDVYKKVGSTLLTVVDGRVKVLARTDGQPQLDPSHTLPESIWKSAPEFHRLQQVEFDDATGTLHERATLTEESLSQFLAWQRGQIYLVNEPLWEALQELSRYQPIDATFTFQDQEMRQMRIGGRLDSTHLADFLVWLEREQGIRHKLARGPHGEAVVTLSRRQREPIR